MEEALWNSLYLTGFALASKLNRKNDEWNIICVIPVQTKVGERRTDIVIGHRGDTTHVQLKAPGKKPKKN